MPLPLKWGRAMGGFMWRLGIRPVSSKELFHFHFLLSFQLKFCDADITTGADKPKEGPAIGFMAARSSGGLAFFFRAKDLQHLPIQMGICRRKGGRPPDKV